MAVMFLSQEWVEQFVQEVKKGPQPERQKKIDENYWRWIQTVKEKMDIRLGFLLKTDKDQNDQIAYLDFEKGELIKGHVGLAEERETAQFILSGSLSDWQEVLQGPRDITQNMMYRKIKLVQGNLHAFFRNIYFFVEMLRSGFRVETDFTENEQDSKAESVNPT